MADKNPATRKVIKIVTIVQKPTSKGKPMWTITDEQDDYYSIFDEFVRSRIVEGSTMALMVEIANRGGKAYKNIVGIAEGPVAQAGEVGVNELLPGNNPAPAPAPLQQTQQPPAPNPPPAAAPTQPAARKPLNVMTSMVDIRIAALAASTRLAAAGLITVAQIEHNNKEFEKYLMGVGLVEHNSSSGEDTDEYIA